MIAFLLLTTTTNGNPQQDTIMPHIPVTEYAQRMRAVQTNVREAGFDLYLVSSFDNLYYLTGAGFEPLERPFFLLIPAVGEPTLLVPLLDQSHMRKAHNISRQRVVHYDEYPAPEHCGWAFRLRELLDGARHIGVEPDLRIEIASQLREYAVQPAPMVEQVRTIKSDAEIQMIRQAAQYADLGVERLLAASYYGATVAEGFAESRGTMTRIIRELDDWQPLTTKMTMATWAAPRSAMPHSIPQLGDRLNEGPHVALSLTRINGYAAESERTYFTHAPSRESRIISAALLEARRIALDAVRPGVACSDIDERVGEFLAREGFGASEQRLHRTGHGIGLGNHEAPWIASGSPDCLAENMVISVEPGIYVAGLGGFRHSDTVLVKANGYESITQQPSDLRSMTIRGLRLRARIRGMLVRRTLRVSRKQRHASNSAPCSR